MSLVFKKAPVHPPVLQDGFTMETQSYNIYHVITQLSSLYALVGSYEQRVQFQGLWSQLVDSMLEDIGDVMEIWEDFSTVQRTGPISIQGILKYRIPRASNRYNQIETLLSPWVESRRCARIILLAENKWNGILLALCEVIHERKEERERLERNHKNRVEILGELISSYDLFFTEVE